MSHSKISEPSAASIEVNMSVKDKNSLHPIYRAFEWSTFAVFLFTLAMFLIRWNDMPEVVATHYNAAGEVDIWARKLTAMTPVVLQFLMWIVISLALRFPAEWAVPVRVRKGNLPVIRATMKMDILGIRFILTLLLMWIELSIIFFKPLGSVFTIVSLVSIVSLFIISGIYLRLACRTQN